jgi:hypothetical protein
MRSILFILFVCSVGTLLSQTLPKAIDDKTMSLQERYQELKSGSQTFKDYKVIKETVLDYEWGITMDSVRAQGLQLAQTKKQIEDLKGELVSIRNSMEVQQASIKEVVYDSTHISVLGIPFSKSVFILLVAAVVAALALAVSVCYARTKMLNRLVKEKAVIADSISLEFEDFKKKAMDKQTKLSRELQNERNKWQDYRKV